MRLRSTRLPGLRALILGSAVAAGGCNTVTPFGTFKTYSINEPSYIAGRAGLTFPSSVDFLEQTRKALDDVGIKSVVERQDAPSMIFEGKTANGRRAFVTVHPQGATTHVSARFGVLGDEPLSRAFLARLGVRLGGDPRPPPEAAAGPGAPRANAVGLDEHGSPVERQFGGSYREPINP